MGKGHNTSTIDQRTVQFTREGQKSPPSYAEALNRSTASSLPPGSTVKLDSIDDSTGQGHSFAGQSVVSCTTRDCQFYGSPENKGYCSACYRTYKKSLKYMIEENEASKSKII